MQIVYSTHYRVLAGRIHGVNAEARVGLALVLGCARRYCYEERIIVISIGSQFVRDRRRLDGNHVNGRCDRGLRHLLGKDSILKKKADHTEQIIQIR
jgi:hypothetical protein